MRLYIINHPYHYEMENLCRVFYPAEELGVVKLGVVKGCGVAMPRPTGVAPMALKQGTPVAITRIQNSQIIVQLFVGKRRLSLSYPVTNNFELTMAQMLFTLLRRATGMTPPWGLLTGVRPSKLMLRLRRDEGEARAARYFRDTLWVSEEKTRLAAEVARAEEPILALTAPRSFSLYVSIPFCPSRCSYCSFVSHTVDRQSAQKLIPAYVDKLCEEVARTGEIARELGLRMESVYIGGGTPTSLTAAQLLQLCEALRAAFDWNHCGEFTVEAGRPDTITAEKLRALREQGVSRVSVNPQSLDDAVLALAGRRHTARQAIDCYGLARDMGFHVNMDLIAGLPGDTPEGFRRSLEGLIALAPENITVHTLALKRAASLDEIHGAAACAQMLRTAAELLPRAGYAPYYMYRQSRSLGNLENTGWSLPGRFCRYNIDMMEESHTILACGAGGVTKLKRCGTDYLERVFGFKYPYEYLSRFEELMERKEKVRGFYTNE